MVHLSNGHNLDFLVASGALNFHGDGYWWEWPFRWAKIIRPHEFHIITKTLTCHPRKGNLKWWCPWRCVRLIKSGVVNSVGLTNPGIRYWIDHYYPIIRYKRAYKTIVSVSPETTDEAAMMARLLSPLLLSGIEVNVSCPSLEYHAKAAEIVMTVKENSAHPVLVKLGWNSYKKLCAELDGKVDVFDLINTVPWKTVFSKPSPLERLGGGGVSGKPIIDFARKALAWYKMMGFKTPVISGGGIDSAEEVYARFVMGANAVSLGSVFLRRPWLPNQIVKRCREEMKKGCGTLS